MPLRLQCGQVLGGECIRHFAWDADASTCITCPFCRASFKHMPITTEIIWEMLLKRMRATMEIFVKLDGKDDIQDMTAVISWAQDFPRFSHDVPEADKREAIEYVVQCRVDMGNENFCPQLAVAVYIPSIQLTPPVKRRFGFVDLVIKGHQRTELRSY